MNMNVVRQISYGVYVVSTMDGERSTGCVANSVMQITSSPATLALSMNHDNYTNECIKKTGFFAVSILSKESNPSLIGTFGFQSGRTVDKFSQVPFEKKAGMPVVTDAAGFIVCKVIDTMETSTHTVFLGEMVEGDILSSNDVMTYEYYHKVVKGKSPKNAPTYLPEEKEEEVKGVYKCGICGYVYQGDEPFENLPEDYVCPICKQPKSVFVKE